MLGSRITLLRSRDPYGPAPPRSSRRSPAAIERARGVGCLAALPLPGGLPTAGRDAFAWGQIASMTVGSKAHTRTDTTFPVDTGRRCVQAPLSGQRALTFAEGGRDHRPTGRRRQGEVLHHEPSNQPRPARRGGLMNRMLLRTVATLGAVVALM